MNEIILHSNGTIIESWEIFHCDRRKMARSRGASRKNWKWDWVWISKNIHKYRRNFLWILAIMGEQMKKKFNLRVSVYPNRFLNTLSCAVECEFKFDGWIFFLFTFVKSKYLRLCVKKYKHNTLFSIRFGLTLKSSLYLTTLWFVQKILLSVHWIAWKLSKTIRTFGHIVLCPLTRVRAWLKSRSTKAIQKRGRKRDSERSNGREKMKR